MTEAEFLKTYDITKYDRPSVTSDIVVFGFQNEEEQSYRQDQKKTLSLLLIKRGGYPFKDKWALPGGFVQKGEKIEQCAFRELKEETGIVPTNLMDIGTYSAYKRDPRGWVISNAFVSLVDEDSVKAVASDDAKEALWFNVEYSKKKNGEYLLELTSGKIKIKTILVFVKEKFGRTEFHIKENSDLAFDHAQIIAEAVFILRKQVEDFEVLFDFLPERFTLTGLQKIQETILGINLLAANFRRKVMPFVEETDEYTSGAGHRPAKLFKRKKVK